MVTVTLVAAESPCRKCDACEALVRRLQEAYPGAIEFRKMRADSPEAEDLGVVMPPMLIVGDLVYSAGQVPAEEALTRLIDMETAEASTRR